MQTNDNSSFVALILGGLLFAATTIPAAYAFDATGTWEGQYKCSESYDGVSSPYKTTGSVMEISQVGDEVRVDVDSGAYHYTGLIINDATKPARKAQTGLIGCTISQNPQGPESEIIRVRLTRETDNPSSVKGKIRGRSVYTGVFGGGERYVGDCTWKYKRTSLVDPGVGNCPPP